MIYQSSSMSNSTTSKSSGPSTMPVDIVTSSKPSNTFYSGRSPVLYHENNIMSIQSTVTTHPKQTSNNYCFESNDVMMDCTGEFDFEQDQMCHDYFSEQSTSNECYTDDDSETENHNRFNLHNAYNCYEEARGGDDWGFEERTKPNDFSSVGDIIGYAKLVKAQRQEAMGQLDSLLSEIDSVFGGIRRGMNARKQKKSQF